ncbi:hypothetical protein K2X30_07005 [bacterium]|jgi:hypothetical protein|nr:hypothetical protein [bacterium]
MFGITLAVLLSLSFLLPAQPAQAKVLRESYLGIAKDDSGKGSYQERHQVEFANNRVQTARTTYANSDGKVIGELTSDFRKMITTPEYSYKDLRDQSSHGIRIDGNQLIVWRQNKGAEREEKSFARDEFDPEALIVGCQGLHYYLIDHLDELRKKKEIPIKYLMPGKLDYYSFTLKMNGEDEKNIYIKITIDNIILRLLTSSLELQYSKADRRLVKYSGLSNITNDQGQIQQVVIDYAYK